MNDFLEQILKALDCNLYYLALQSTLSLPDICSALISPNGMTSGSQYINWYNTYAKEPGSLSINGEDCYKFRCSAIHQGSTQHARSSYSRILFIEASRANGIIIHNTVLNDALNIDLRVFCENMVQSVVKWLELVKDDPIFLSNYEKFMKRYPNGFPPYIVGISIIT